MERAEILSRLRGDKPTSIPNTTVNPDSSDEDFESQAKERFPDIFRDSVPKNAQRLILWCLARDPGKRPNAEELLNSELLPRKIELEQRYLSEALQLLTSPQSESFMQIVGALFSKPVKELVNVTFDTDIAVKATNVNHGRVGRRQLTAPEALLRAILGVRSGSVDMMSISSLAMSDSSLVAATSSIKRSSNTGKLGKGGRGMLKRATQRTAGILAMRAASATAVTGALDGVHGADPLVSEYFCKKMKQIFENQGAVRLRSPLLRPRSGPSTSSKGGGPAELLSTRGVVLVLPEDLTAPFARAVGRGGSATSNVKRYDINRVYHKSDAGGHPREAMEASFDIVHEDHGRGQELYAECLFVASRVIKLLPSTKGAAVSDDVGPLWFIRINHTRLAEALLDLCGVPPKESVRLSAHLILGRFTAPTVYNLKQYLMSQGHLSDIHQSSTSTNVERDRLEEAMADAERNHGLPSAAARRLRIFIQHCGVLSPNAGQSINKLKEAIVRLRNTEKLQSSEPKLLKRFEDAARSLKMLRDIIAFLESSMSPVVTSSTKAKKEECSPLFISIDFGLRQRRKHYHGGLIFQCIVLPESYLERDIPDESNDTLISSTGPGIRVAEGGDFTDLVRRNRPPGNFASTVLNRYTSSPIPFCCGVRFAVGKLVELAYVSAVLDNDIQADFSGHNDVTHMRNLLGHPLSYADSVRVIVASVHGLDAASSPQRFQVACLLWSAGISAEYLHHSGIMLSLLKRIHDDNSPENTNASDWSLVELCGVCALLRIPFVVILQPHLLKEKNSVRLRRINFETSSNQPSNAEIFVSLDNLVATILEDKSFAEESNGGDEGADTTNAVQPSISGSQRGLSINCIYIDSDSYYGMEREISKSETPHWKAYLKSIKKVELSAESFVETLRESEKLGSVPVFAVSDASFWALRDFGTALMRREREQSATNAYVETAEKWPKYKRSLKTLATAVDAFMRRQGIWTSGSSGGKHQGQQQPSNRSEVASSQLLTLLLYSKLDDRFDVITMSQARRAASQSLSRRR
jgi:histidyl-tRNA synthetase